MVLTSASCVINNKGENPKIYVLQNKVRYDSIGNSNVRGFEKANGAGVTDVVIHGLFIETLPRRYDNNLAILHTNISISADFYPKIEDQEDDPTSFNLFAKSTTPKIIRYNARKTFPHYNTDSYCYSCIGYSYDPKIIDRGNGRKNVAYGSGDAYIYTNSGQLFLAGIGNYRQDKCENGGPLIGGNYLTRLGSYLNWINYVKKMELTGNSDEISYQKIYTVGIPENKYAVFSDIPEHHMIIDLENKAKERKKMNTEELVLFKDSIYNE
ncbi:hypothetical protein AYI68_g4232 [Smittium mucronatum]|uniref:Peptidase S1 domain-containing protein n=1 Tax=Smittium mucronatum TaxID=133383 RepID=A0A1R0GXN7_9FUNG|nr:hypothetical protein AYI68_g4232 [Smittium mucronatum]